MGEAKPTSHKGNYHYSIAPMDRDEDTPADINDARDDGDCAGTITVF